MFINVYLHSKNFNKIKIFVRFFKKVLFNRHLNIKISIKNFNKYTLKKEFSILKSPHVNKKAQEQFYYSTYRQQISLFSYQPLLILKILKLIKSSCAFAGVNIQIKIAVNSSKFYKTLLREIKINRYFLHSTKNIKSLKKINSLSNLTKTKVVNLNSYLQLCDLNGEINLIKNNLYKSLGSSVG